LPLGTRNSVAQGRGRGRTIAAARAQCRTAEKAPGKRRLGCLREANPGFLKPSVAPEEAVLIGQVSACLRLTSDDFVTIVEQASKVKSRQAEARPTRTN